MIQTLFRTLNRQVLPLVRAGLANPLPLGAGLVVAETTGRVSGKQRPVPLMSTRLGDRLTMSTFRPDSQWLANVEADPSMTVFVNGTRREGTAVVCRGALNIAHVTLEPLE
jgi:hypothetical protein